MNLESWILTWCFFFFKFVSWSILRWNFFSKISLEKSNILEVPARKRETTLRNKPTFATVRQSQGFSHWECSWDGKTKKIIDSSKKFNTLSFKQSEQLSIYKNRYFLNLSLLSDFYRKISRHINWAHRFIGFWILYCLLINRCKKSLKNSKWVLLDWYIWIWFLSKIITNPHSIMDYFRVQPLS